MDSTDRDPPASTARSLKLGLLILFVLISARLGWLSDDSFISFRTVQNFVRGYGLTWNVDERVQAFTNPLWVFLISGVYGSTHEIFISTILTSVLVSGAAVAVVLYRLSNPLPRAIAVVLILISSQAVLDYSTSGLENPLSYLLSALFYATWLRSPGQSRPIFWLFLTGALLAMNRQDLVLLVAPALGLALYQSRTWRALRHAVMGLLPVLLWEAFSIIYYGFPFPNTYYAKLSTGLTAHEYRVQGFVYLLDVLAHDPATLLIVVLGIGTAVTDRPRSQLLPLGVGLALYLWYTVSVGGDFMQGRFLSVPAFVGAIILTQGTTRDSTRIGNGDHDSCWRPLLLACVVAAMSSVRFFIPATNDPPIRVSGVADERKFYLETNSLVAFVRDLDMPNNHPWSAIGRAMRDNPTEHIFTSGAIGMEGWVAGPNVHIVDFYGLSDPLIARISSVTPWRIGHFQRTVPNEYLDSLRTGQNRFHSAVLGHLYDQLQLVTRGPLFRWARFKAMWDLNFVHVHADLSDEAERLHLSLAQLSTVKPEGYYWSGAGTFQIYAAGADVEVGGVSHATSLSISADNNDRYVIEFLLKDGLGSKLVGTTAAPEKPVHAGLIVHQLQIPATASARGFDLIRIIPQGGDGQYSIGHLILN